MITSYGRKCVNSFIKGEINTFGLISETEITQRKRKDLFSLVIEKESMVIMIRQVFLIIYFYVILCLNYWPLLNGIFTNFCTLKMGHPNWVTFEIERYRPVMKSNYEEHFLFSSKLNYFSFTLKFFNLVISYIWILKKINFKLYGFSLQLSHGGDLIKYDSANH